MEVIPEKLRVSIGGYMGPSYSVELNGDTLVYTPTTRGYEDMGGEEMRPSVKMWAEFWSCLNDIEFWSWRGSYSPVKWFLMGPVGR